jgi:hypothetical protein
MFWASLRPSSRAYQLQQQPLVYRWNVVVAVLLVVVGPSVSIFFTMSIFLLYFYVLFFDLLNFY